MSLKGKRILMTGANGGLGQATTALLKEKGARVVGIDKKERLGQVDPDLIIADIRDPNAITKAVREAINRLGGLDILINNAGVLDLQDPLAPPNEGTSEAVEVHLMGLWRVTSLALPSLLESNGRIVNVASLFAVVNAPFIPAYCATKRAVTAFSDVLRMQYRGKLKVVTVYPGFMDTPIHEKAVQQGLSVKRVVTFKFGNTTILSLEESLNAAARGMLRACTKQMIRDRGLTFLGTTSLFFARHTPRLVDWFINARLTYLMKKDLKVVLE